MGIDRIGRRTPPTSPEVSSVPGGKPSSNFRVNETQEVKKTEEAGPIARVGAGALDRAGYVKARIDEATSHLDGLPAGTVDTVRSVLRQMCETDPRLSGLVDLAMSAQPDAGASR